MAELILADSRPEDHKHFEALNLQWLEHYFVVEAEDKKILGDPQKYILDKGGHIIMAKIGNDIVGCCALKNDGNGSYELAKMAVSPEHQGKGIGRKIGEAIINRAKKISAKELYLISSSTLAPALHLYDKLGFVYAEVTEEDKSRYCRCDVRMVFPHLNRES